MEDYRRGDVLCQVTMIDAARADIAAEARHRIRPIPVACVHPCAVRKGGTDLLKGSFDPQARGLGERTLLVWIERNHTYW